MTADLSQSQLATLQSLRQCGGRGFPADVAKAGRLRQSLAEVMANLEMLEDAGHVTATPEGGRVVFEVTRGGLAAMVRATEGAGPEALPQGVRPA